MGQPRLPKRLASDDPAGDVTVTIQDLSLCVQTMLVPECFDLNIPHIVYHNYMSATIVHTAI